MDTINLSNFCYDILSQNRHVFDDLKQYDIDHSQNTNEINKFVSNQTCCKNYYGLIANMLNSVEYVSCDTFIYIINNNIQELTKLIHNGYIPILLTTKDLILKSNFFYSMYLLNKLQNSGIKIFNIYETMNDILNLDGKITINITDNNGNILDTSGNVKC